MMIKVDRSVIGCMQTPHMFNFHLELMRDKFRFGQMLTSVGIWMGKCPTSNEHGVFYSKMEFFLFLPRSINNLYPWNNKLSSCSCFRFFHLRSIKRKWVKNNGQNLNAYDLFTATTGWIDFVYRNRIFAFISHEREQFCAHFALCSICAWNWPQAKRSYSFSKPISVAFMSILFVFCVSIFHIVCMILFFVMFARILSIEIIWINVYMHAAQTTHKSHKSFFYIFR